MENYTVIISLNCGHQFHYILTDLTPKEIQEYFCEIYGTIFCSIIHGLVFSINTENNEIDYSVLKNVKEIKK